MPFLIRAVTTGVKFDLKAANGQTVASSEVYSSPAACRKGIESVIRCAPTAPVVDLSAVTVPVNNPKFEIYPDRSGGWRFRLRSRNGKIIAASEQSYTTRAVCLRAVEWVKAHTADDSPQIHP